MTTTAREMVSDPTKTPYERHADYRATEAAWEAELAEAVRYGDTDRDEEVRAILADLRANAPCPY
jgi:hypothetical protein